MICLAKRVNLHYSEARRLFSTVAVYEDDGDGVYLPVSASNPSHTITSLLTLILFSLMLDLPIVAMYILLWQYCAKNIFDRNMFDIVTI